MVGTMQSGSGAGEYLQGDAELSYNANAGAIDAAFLNIVNIDRNRAHSTSSVRFTGVPVSASGTFTAGTSGNLIRGGFYGSGHAETAGVFEQSGIVGAFGARR